MSKFGYACLGVVLMSLAAGPAVAQNSKAAGAAAAALGYFEGASWGDVPGMSVDIRVPSQEDLVFDVALQCSLMTDTTAKSKGGNKDTSTAEAGVKVRVRIEDLDGDGNVIVGTDRYAEPNADIGQAADSGVTYCYRKQELSATLQGIIETLACFPDDVFDPDDPDCDLTEEEIQLVLTTLAAHAFNFFAYDFVSGDYRITVEANPDAKCGGADCPNGGDDSSASAFVGLGSMVIDEVRFGSVPN